MDIQQIIYISTARGMFSPFVVDQILKTSRRNNLRHGISGLLVVGGRRFLQVLEGPRRALGDTYDRIEADARHFAIVRLNVKTIGQRSFADWGMGYRDAGNPEDIESLASIVKRLTVEVNDASLKAELLTFASLHDKAA